VAEACPVVGSLASQGIAARVGPASPLHGQGRVPPHWLGYLGGTTVTGEADRWMPVTGDAFARLGPEDRITVLWHALHELVICELTLRMSGPFAAGALYAAGGRTRIGPDGGLEVRVLAGDGP
jgi:hypothetical protein